MDLIGKRIDKLLVLSFDSIKSGRKSYLCLCDCGNEIILNTKYLNRKDKVYPKSCGCNKDHILKKRSDLTGQVFGKLTAISYHSSDKRGGAKWLCKCECGNDKIVQARDMIYGKINSCDGFLHRSGEGNRNYKHGKSYDKLYVLWSDIKDRCFNSNAKHYKHYGGRGITICQEWLNFETFYSDIFPLYQEAKNKFQGRLTIDRINFDGNYEKSNVRITNDFFQCRNKRNNKFLEYKGIIKIMKDWSNIFNISTYKIRNGLKNGFTFKEIINQEIYGEINAR